MAAEYENEVRRLLKLNKRFEAVRYLQNTLNVSNTDADQLVRAVENEIVSEEKAAGKPAAATAVGCGKMLVKAMGFGFGFFGLGFILMGIGAYLLLNYVEPEAVEVPGRVVELRKSNSGEGMAPVIEYSWNGETKTYYSEVYSSPPDFDEGQVVSVWVDPDNPENATVIYQEMSLIVIWIFGGLGVFFLIISVVLFRLSRKMNSPL